MEIRRRAARNCCTAGAVPTALNGDATKKLRRSGTFPSVSVVVHIARAVAQLLLWLLLLRSTACNSSVVTLAVEVQDMEARGAEPEHQLHVFGRKALTAGKREYIDNAAGMLLSTAAATDTKHRSLKEEQQQQVQHASSPLCLAAVSYVAVLGDVGSRHVAQLPTFFGNINLGLLPNSVAKDQACFIDDWVLHWQFAAGEYVQYDTDIFGDSGMYDKYLTESNNGNGVAVLSNSTIGSDSNGSVGFSFVGRKGPDDTNSSHAPFRVAPPAQMFLNDLPCWPLFRPSSSTADAAGTGSSVSGPVVPGSAATEAADAAAPLVDAAAQASGEAVAAEQQYMDVAVPQQAEQDMPRQLLVEYSPIQFRNSSDPFVKRLTMFYFKISNLQSRSSSEPVYLDQLVLQYWFQGPQELTAAAMAAAGSNSNTTASIVEAYAASQFVLYCTDTKLPGGCKGLAWNVTAGLPGVMGAWYIVSIWFPAAPNYDSTGAGNDSSNSSSLPIRYRLLGKNSSAADSQSTIAFDAGFGEFLNKPVTDVQAVVALHPRRLFANMNAQADYSFQDTPIINDSRSNVSTGRNGSLIRHVLEANPRMPVYIAGTLAWGSPPVATKVLNASHNSGSSALSNTSLPPGSYCTVNAKGSLTCGIDVMYCCIGSFTSNSRIPPNWMQQMPAGTNLRRAQPPNATADTSLDCSDGHSSCNGAAVSNQTNSSGVQDTDGGNTSKPYVIALAVVLPVVVLAAAGGLFAFMRWFKREVHRSSTTGRTRDLGAAPFLPDNTTAAAAVRSSPDYAGGADPCAWSDTMPHRLKQHQQPLLIGAGDVDVGRLTSTAASHPASSPFAQSGWQPQLGTESAEVMQHSSAGLGAAVVRVHDAELVAAAGDEDTAGQQKVALTWLKKAMGKTMPEDVLGRAIQQYKSLQEHGQGQPSSMYAGDDMSDSSKSDSPKPPDAPLRRCSSCAERLHEDAFGEDLLSALLQLHVGRHNDPRCSALGAARASQGVTKSAVQRSGQCPGRPAAAAMMAAVSVIEATLLGTSSHTATADTQSPHAPAYAHPLDASNSTAGAPRLQSFSASSQCPVSVLLPDTCNGSFTTPHASTKSVCTGGAGCAAGRTPSFLQALMASGGVIHPPQGPPIPLNVDYATEIEPNLGPLLGKGGFAYVYEATWRGRKVAVKLLSVDTEDPGVLDAFIKEVALCACLRGCDRVVKLLGACLGGINTAASLNQAQPQHQQASLSTAGVIAVPDAAGAVTASGNTSAVAAAARGSSSSSLSTRRISAEYTPFRGHVPAAVAAMSAGSSAALSSEQRTKQQLALIMELVEGGNLAQRIYHPSKRRLTYLEVLQIGLDISRGLAYLHPAVVHRDLKPHNVLLDKQGRAKIADFGISRFKLPNRSYLSVTHQGGTPNYMAPELFNGTRVDEAADVYSLGCILYECIARQQPFGHLAAGPGDAKSFNLLFKIIVAVAINKQRPQLPSSTPPRLASLIARCWLEDSTQRPTVAEVEAELQDMMQEELELRTNMLGRVHRLAKAQRSRSSPIPAALSISSSNSTSSEQGSDEEKHSGTMAAEHAPSSPPCTNGSPALRATANVTNTSTAAAVQVQTAEPSNQRGVGDSLNRSAPAVSIAAVSPGTVSVRPAVVAAHVLPTAAAAVAASKLHNRSHSFDIGHLQQQSLLSHALEADDEAVTSATDVAVLRHASSGSSTASFASAAGSPPPSLSLQDWAVPDAVVSATATGAGTHSSVAHEHAPITLRGSKSTSIPPPCRSQRFARRQHILQQDILLIDQQQAGPVSSGSLFPGISSAGHPSECGSSAYNTAESWVDAAKAAGTAYSGHHNSRVSTRTADVASSNSVPLRRSFSVGNLAPHLVTGLPVRSGSDLFHQQVSATAAAAVPPETYDTANSRDQAGITASSSSQAAVKLQHATAHVFQLVSRQPVGGVVPRSTTVGSIVASIEQAGRSRTSDIMRAGPASQHMSISSAGAAGSGVFNTAMNNSSSRELMGLRSSTESNGSRSTKRASFEFSQVEGDGLLVRAAESSAPIASVAVAAPVARAVTGSGQDAYASRTVLNQQQQQHQHQQQQRPQQSPAAGGFYRSALESSLQRFCSPGLTTSLEVQQQQQQQQQQQEHLPQQQHQWWRWWQNPDEEPHQPLLGRQQQQRKMKLQRHASHGSGGLHASKSNRSGNSVTDSSMFASAHSHFSDG